MSSYGRKGEGRFPLGKALAGSLPGHSRLPRRLTTVQRRASVLHVGEILGELDKARENKIQKDFRVVQAAMKFKQLVKNRCQQGGDEILKCESDEEIPSKHQDPAAGNGAGHTVKVGITERG